MKRLLLLFLTLSVATWSQAQQVQQSISEFAFDMYRQISGEQDDNVVFSPFSISSAMGMVALGSRGETRQQIGQVFHFKPDNPLDHWQLGSLQKEIAALSNDSNQICIANRVYLEKTYKIKRKYRKALRANYFAKIYSTDFISSPEPSRQLINKIIEADTKNLIQNLLPSGSILSDTRMVLTNAIYFKGKWKYAFNPDLTNDRNFTLSNGDKIKCPTMRVKAAFKTYEASNYRALQMDYQGSQLSMLILLPNADVPMKEFEKLLDYSLLQTTIDGLASKGKVQLYLPKFLIQSESISLKDQLAEMGMPLAFSNMADFSGITAHNDLKIGNVFHKAFIEVSEEGTTAAAATAVSMVMKTAIGPQNIFDVNRPFVYILTDNAKRTILFMGKVEHPI